MLPSNSLGSNYLDNLALVDRTVGEIRNAMEAAGLWQDTSVLLSADHHLRAMEDLRVPFLLKLAGQTSPSTFDTPFNTLATHDLILAILAGEVRDSESALRLLARFGKGQRPMDSPVMPVEQKRAVSALGPIGNRP